MQRLQFADLFVGQFGVRNARQGSQEIGHQSWFAGRPLALERPLHGGQSLVGVRAGLVFQLGRAAFDEQFQKIECAVVDFGLRALANFGQMLDD